MNVEKAEKLLLSADTYLQPGYFFDFCKNVLHRDLEEEPHREMCDVVEYLVDVLSEYYPGKITPPEHVRNYFINLTPRDSFKSTVFTECLTVYLITIYPNIRVLIASETSTKAKMFCKAVMDHLENNDTYISLYGDKTPKKKDDDHWTTTNFSVRDRTVVGMKEDTVTTCGIGTSLPGYHFDVVIPDDLVSDKNTTTPDQIMATINYIAYLQSLLSPYGVLNIVGTRYHFSDAYGDILDTPEKKEEYNVYVRAASKFVKGKEILYFPKRLTKAFLKKKKKLQGPYIFSCQYYNNPVQEGDQAFDFRKYKLISITDFRKYVISKKNYYWHYYVDPALTEEKKRKGDYTAMSPYVVTPDERRYLYRPKAVREGEDTVATTIYLHHKSLSKELGKPYSSHFEMIGFQKLLVKEMKLLERNHGHKIHWTEQKTETPTTKEIRIRSAIPWLEEGLLYLVVDNPKPGFHNLEGAIKMLVDQAMRFPLCKNDDMLDNQGYMIDLSVTPRGSKTRPKGADFDDDWEDSDEPINIVEDMSHMPGR